MIWACLLAALYQRIKWLTRRSNRSASDTRICLASSSVIDAGGEKTEDASVRRSPGPAVALGMLISCKCTFPPAAGVGYSAPGSSKRYGRLIATRTSVIDRSLGEDRLQLPRKAVLLGVAVQLAPVRVRHVSCVEALRERDVRHQPAIPLEEVRNDLPVRAAKRGMILPVKAPHVIRDCFFVCKRHWYLCDQFYRTKSRR